MFSLGSVARHGGLGVALIAAVSLVLLLSDTTQRRSDRRPRVALMQYSHTQIMEDGIRGVLDSLRANGYEPGRGILLDRFNAENDLPTANAMARELVSGRYDYIITISTNCLQAVGNANRERRVPHVFGLVADPPSTKVGIHPSDPMQHPPNMVGVGNLAPMGDLLAHARQFNPRLRRVGMPWDSSQANSEKYAILARDAARELGIELIEGSVQSTSEVGEVSSSLVARGAEALLLSGDQTVTLGIEALIGAARRGRVPVLSTMPATVSRGVLFAMGFDYYEVGRDTGDLAAKVMKGADPAGIPIRYVTPRQYAVNRQALEGLKGAWEIPEAVLKGAAKVI